MPTLEFAFDGEGAPVATLDAPEGGSLLDLCDDAHAPVPFSCRSANCGTCRVYVLGNPLLLEPPDPDESRGLLDLGAEAPVRLACRARVRPGPGRLRILAIAALSGSAPTP